MQWTDDAIVLSLRPHGEHGVILETLTHGHGRHLGLVHGGMSAKRRSALQPGNSLRLQWRARLSENLGTFSVELLRARAGLMFEHHAALAGLNAFTAMAGALLPEREPHAALYEGAVALLDAITIHDFADWGPLFVRWELRLLDELGFGLDLPSGANEQSNHISPRTGRAVSAGALEANREKPIALPQFLVGAQWGRPSAIDLLAGLRLTAHFIEQSVLAPHGKSLPRARLHLAEMAARALSESA